MKRMCLLEMPKQDLNNDTIKGHVKAEKGKSLEFPPLDKEQIMTAERGS